MNTKIKLIVITLVFIAVLSINSLLSSADEIFKIADEKYQGKIKTINKEQMIPNLMTQLSDLYEKYIRAKENTKIVQVDSTDVSGSVVVTVFPKYGLTTEDIDLSGLEQYNVEIQARAKSSLRASVPIGSLKKIAVGINNIGEIRLPQKPVLCDVISEGVALIKADYWKYAGYDGIDTKIAIIDAGFDNLTEAQNNNELPLECETYDFTGLGLQTTTQHGTAVAEAVHDMAPGSQLYLYKISDITDFELAVDACKANGVDIINHSMSWFNAGGYYDGTGIVCDIVQDAIDNGDIIWVNSAGNAAMLHYRATFDPNPNGYHLFGGSYIYNPLGPDPHHAYYHNPGDEVIICLNWNDYPVSDQDYDLYLIKWTSSSSWVVVDSSVNRQDGIIAPEESIHLINQEQQTPYGIIIKRYTATANVDFTVYSLRKGLGHYSASSSISDPAVVNDVITVGAINSSIYDTGPQESFSSQGPTNDSRIKPDIMGPDNCRSFTYGAWFGTSLSSPHVAGGLALIKSRYSSYVNSEIKNYMFTDCVLDLGDIGKDNIYGWGAFVMPPGGVLAILDVFPNSWNYGKIGLGHYADREFILTNIDSISFDITDITLSGLNSDQFEVLYPPALPLSLSIDDSIKLITRFNPSSLGVKNADIIITNNSDNASPNFKITLAGECINDWLHFSNIVGPTGRTQPVFIIDAKLDGNPFSTGNEIGIFDNDLLVGAYKVTEPYNANPAIVFLSYTAPNNIVLPGAMEGNAIQFKYWDKTSECEYDAEISEMINGTPVFHEGSIVAVKLNASSVIPVELSLFEAIIHKEYIELIWQTLSESNNYGFEVERSTNRILFSKIGFVNGSVTTTKSRDYSYIDRNLESGEYYFRLKQIDCDGGYYYSNVVQISLNLPSVSSLSQNYPNPFNPKTILKYNLKESNHVTLTIYNLAGQEIRTLINEFQTAGAHQIMWTAERLPSGIYFYKLQAGEFSETKKLIFQK